jgi:hypothetical protein
MVGEPLAFRVELIVPSLPRASVKASVRGKR